MIGMTFLEFGVLLIAGLISAAVLHYAVCYRFLTGLDGLLGKWIAGWFGAWLGSPVFGHWFEPVKFRHVYLIPALGAFVGSFAITAMGKAIAKAFASHATYAPGAGADMPKAA